MQYLFMRHCFITSVQRRQGNCWLCFKQHLNEFLVFHKALSLGFFRIDVLGFRPYFAVCFRSFASTVVPSVLVCTWHWPFCISIPHHWFTAAADTFCPVTWPICCTLCAHRSLLSTQRHPVKYAWYPTLPSLSKGAVVPVGFIFSNS